jgi:hypothetical protein
VFGTVHQRGEAAALDLSAPVVDAPPPGPDGPWRPVQYLGSKLRALDHIIEAVQPLVPLGATVWEPFAGSTVVSQALAAHSYRVVAGDALKASGAFATAMLGVGRGEDVPPTALGEKAAEVVDAARAAMAASDEVALWQAWLEQEEAALADKDGGRLLAVDAELPQRWRRPGAAHERLDAYFADIEHAAEGGGAGLSGLLSATYAGTYFGLRQALELEHLRAALDQALNRESADSRWLRAGLLTALCHAASMAVFSPGKHFAQPHRIRDGKELDFHAKRVLSDRSIDVVEHFRYAAEQIDARARWASEGHRAHNRLVEETSAADLRGWGVQAVYADPPYTAQQYSRFYHLLETLVTGTPPTLQTTRGAVTRGLYPEDRYLSPYCSRVKAPGAIRDLARKTADADAHLMLSYSDSRGQSTGNARSVSLDVLVDCVKDAFGADRVTVHQLSLRYRQFNHSSAGVSGRDDPEYLVVGRKNAR